MIEIDGSYGEGGGALLRISTALSALTGKAIRVNNIRAKRPRKGLMPQHLHALKAVAELCDASHEGLKIGSTEISFCPNASPRGGEYNLDIGTAGSITLVLQSFMIPAAFADSPVEITIRGGTDVRWSPSADYLQHVTLPILKSIGYSLNQRLVRRGHYPKGGGILKVEISTIEKLNSIKLVDLHVRHIKGVSHSVRLPEHVAVRQARSAEELLKKEGFEVEIEVQHSDQALGPGSGIVLWTEGKSRVGGSSIGEPGKRAELVGQEAAEELRYHISRNSALDKYMGDQIIPYMAIAGDSLVKTAELTQHALTNIYAAETITGKKFEVDGALGDPATISVN